MSGDVTLAVSGVEDTPLDYPIPAAAQLQLKMLTASYNGSGAASSFVPAVKIVFAGNVVVGTFPLGQSLAAGASADVSWFPFVNTSVVTNPVVANQLDYVEIVSSVGFSAPQTEAAPKVLITGNSVTYDGATRVRVEAFSPHYDLSAPSSGNFLTNLWMDSTDLGRFAILNTDAGNSDIGLPYYGVRYLTPPAGSHVFSIRGWTTAASGVTCTFEAGPGGAGDDLPAYLRIST